MLKKYFKLGAAIYLSLPFLLLSAPVFAQEAEDIELEKIVVTNRRANIGLGEATENVEVVTEKQIKQLPARNLAEALRYISGVDIDIRKGFSRPTTLSIQGSDSRQVRVMVDGIPFNTQSSGQVNPSIFPIENIARIEVIKGSSSSIWGSSLGGVINIITKDTGKSLVPEGSVTTSFAEFRTQKEYSELSGKIDGLGYYLFMSYMNSGGRGWRDDVLEKKGFAKLSYDLKEMGKLIGSFGYSGVDAHNGESPDGTWESQPQQFRFAKVGWELNSEEIGLKVDLKHSRQKIIYRLYNSVFDEVPALAISTQDMLYQLSITTNFHPRNKDLLVLGADFDWDALKSDTYLTKAKSVKLQAPYTNYTLKLEPWDFNFGLRFDHNSEFGEELSPSFGILYHFKSNPDTLLRVHISRAFNAPPLLWKYNNAQNSVPNPDLKPERAWVYELGFESKLHPKVWTKLSLYRADVSDAISGEEIDGTGNFWMNNFEKFRRQGVELQGKLELIEELSFFASGAFNDIENRATDETVQGGGRPRQSFDVGIEYKNKKGLSVSLRGNYDWWNETPVEYENQLGELVSVDANDRKFIFDLKISQEFKNLAFFLNIYNLANSKYWSDFFLPLPERYFEGGITLKW